MIDSPASDSSISDTEPSDSTRIFLLQGGLHPPPSVLVPTGPPPPRGDRGGYWEGQPHAFLVEALQEGDRKAFDWIANTYREDLLRYARRILGDQGDPEDVVQEALLRVWTHRKTLRPTGSIRALLFISTRTIALDEYRKWGGRMVTGERIDEAPSVDDPSSDLFLAELGENLREAVDHLSPRRKEVFRLVREQGLSMEDTATALHLETRTVKNTMSSALAELRKILKPLLR